MPGIGLKSDVGVGPASIADAAVGMRPEVSGVSMTPYVSLTACLLRNLVRVQTSTVIPAIRILDSPEDGSSSVTRTIVPGIKKSALTCSIILSIASSPAGDVGLLTIRRTSSLETQA